MAATLVLDVLLASLLLGAGQESAPPEPGSFDTDLRAALDRLAAPAAYRLSARTMILGAKSPQAGRLREFLSERDGRPGTFEGVHALCEELRVELGASDPTAIPSLDEACCWAGSGEADEWRIIQGERRFHQRLIGAVGVPLVLVSPAVVLLYDDQSNTLDLHDAPMSLELYGTADLLSPLPLAAKRREHWLKETVVPVEESATEVLVSVERRGRTLELRCDAARPGLPIAAWQRESGDADHQIAVFVSYETVDLAPVLSSVYCVRQSGVRFRVDESRLHDLAPPPPDERITLPIPADARLWDNTGLRRVRLDSLDEINPGWRALLTIVR